MRLPLYQIDAFAPRVFGGNPAAVVPLESWLPDAVMQSIAAENNLAETAFFAPDPERGGYGLRWFTPTVEVPLCGHATLASAFVVFTEIDPKRSAAVFHTQSGTLTVTRDGDRLQMDFPRHPLTQIEASPALLAGLKMPPREVYFAADNPNYYAVYETEAEVRALAPDSDALLPLGALGVCVTAAPGTDCDFVSRYFAPGFGIPEDPVTGSTHCALAPLWAGRLGKSGLSAKQVSARGGELRCMVTENRVLIAGRAALYLRGEIFIEQVS